MAPFHFTVTEIEGFDTPAREVAVRPSALKKAFRAVRNVLFTYHDAYPDVARSHWEPSDAGWRLIIAAAFLSAAAGLYAWLLTKPNLDYYLEAGQLGSGSPGWREGGGGSLYFAVFFAIFGFYHLFAFANEIKRKK